MQEGCVFKFTKDQLIRKLDRVTQSGKFYFVNKSEATPDKLLTFLYKINFLTARKKLQNGEIQRKYFDELHFLANTYVDFGYEWEIHPAYRRTLLPESVDDFF